MFNQKPSKPRTPPPPPPPPMRKEAKGFQLWTPLEWVMLSTLNVAVFAFLLGQGNFTYVFELLGPVIAFGGIVVALQWGIFLGGWLRSDSGDG